MSKFVIWFHMLIILFASFAVSDSFADGRKIKVLASIEPIAVILRDIFGDDAEVETIVSGAASPHHFAMTPFQLKQLSDADLVVWIDPQFEFFLKKAIAQRVKKRAVVIQWSKLDGLLWPEGLPEYIFEELPEEKKTVTSAEHTHSHDHHERDNHLWLNPHNVKVLATQIKKFLLNSQVEKNILLLKELDTYISELEVLQQQIYQSMSLLKHTNYAVFHNAYGHFALAFSLKSGQYLMQVPDEQISAKRLLMIKRSVVGSSCLIADISERNEANKWSETLNIPVVEVDVLAVNQPENGYTYELYLQSIADRFKSCFVDAI